jgi:hypothetical protein
LIFFCFVNLFSCLTFTFSSVFFKDDMADGNPPPGLNPNAEAFSMDGLIAAATSLQRDCRLPDFVLEKPEAWFKCVKAQLEYAKVTKPKNRYNKVLGKLPVNIIEELAPVTDDPSAYADPYTALKERLLAAYGRSKWEKLDSLLNFPKMGVNKWPSVVLARLNTLKPASLEELYMAIYLRVLPDGYHEHFSQCQFMPKPHDDIRLRRSWRPLRTACGR